MFFKNLDLGSALHVWATLLQLIISVNISKVIIQNENISAEGAHFLAIANANTLNTNRIDAHLILLYIEQLVLLPNRVCKRSLKSNTAIMISTKILPTAKNANSATSGSVTEVAIFRDTLHIITSDWVFLCENFRICSNKPSVEQKINSIVGFFLFGDSLNDRMSHFGWTIDD